MTDEQPSATYDPVGNAGALGVLADNRTTRSELFACVLTFMSMALLAVVVAKVLAFLWKLCVRHFATKRASNGEDLEAEQSSARLQYVRIDDEWRAMRPQFWGITLVQCKEYLRECKKDVGWDPACNMYTFVEDYIKPKTRGTGVGLALLCNSEAPQEVTVMVSHAWGENVAEFFEALERSVDDDEAMFICAFSLYQCQDGAGPSIDEQLGATASESPFWRVLDNIRAHGRDEGMSWSYSDYIRMVTPFLVAFAITLFFWPMVWAGCVLNTQGCKVPDIEGQALNQSSELVSYVVPDGAFAASWRMGVRRTQDWYAYLPATLVAASSAAFSGLVDRFIRVYSGRMLVVPNRQCDLYARLWCVYEIFVAYNLGVPVQLAHTLATAGTCGARDAMCAQPQDMQRIRAEIEAFGKKSGRGAQCGYKCVDAAIRTTTNSSLWGMYFNIVQLLWPIVLLNLGVVRFSLEGKPLGLRSRNGNWIAAGFVGRVVGVCYVFYVVYKAVKDRQGMLFVSDLRALACKFLGHGVVYCSCFIASFASGLYSSSVFIVSLALGSLSRELLAVASVFLSLVLTKCWWIKHQGKVPRLLRQLKRVAGVNMVAIILVCLLDSNIDNHVLTLMAYTSVVVSILGIPAIWIAVLVEWGVQVVDDAALPHPADSDTGDESTVTEDCAD
mmetsp:Transcript_48691/g.136178  ORF Transcript_48691/g.136178 Transcript_48691/m.136178 type:complete len:670 (+) Transcript_48691:178-2187(+)